MKAPEKRMVAYSTAAIDLTIPSVWKPSAKMLKAVERAEKKLALKLAKDIKREKKPEVHGRLKPVSKS